MHRLFTKFMFTMIVTGLFYLNAASVCRAELNDVQSLQSALEDGDPVPVLEKYVDRLNTISELLAASQLSGLVSRDALEPLDPVRGKELADLLDNKIRKPLLNQVKLTVEKGNPLAKRALATRVAELKIITSGFHHPNAQKRYRDFIVALSKQMEDLILAKNEQPAVREAAARALGKILVDPQSAVSALASLFGSQRSAGEKLAAAVSLHEMAETHANLWLRVGTSNNLLLQKETLLDLADRVLKLSAQGLAEPELSVRKTSLETIGKLSGRIESASLLRVPPGTAADIQNVKAGEPELQPILKDFNNVIQTKAFLATLSDPDAALRRQSRKILEQLATIRLKIFLRQESIPEKERPEVDWLIDGLKKGMQATLSDLDDPNPNVRLAAVEFLERLALPNDGANRALSARMRDPIPFVRWSAARALGRIGYEQLHPLERAGSPATLDDKSLRQVVDGLALGLNDRDVDVRTAVGNIIAALAFSAQNVKSEELHSRAVAIVRNAVPSLVGASNRGDAKARVAVLKALYYSGVNPEQTDSAVETLAAVLENAEPTVRQAAAETLGSFGKAAAEAIPALQRALQDDDGEVRKAAGDAILQIMS